jgi:hypothetical protein
MYGRTDGGKDGHDKTTGRMRFRDYATRLQRALKLCINVQTDTIFARYASTMNRYVVQ